MQRYRYDITSFDIEQAWKSSGYDEIYHLGSAFREAVDPPRPAHLNARPMRATSINIVIARNSANVPPRGAVSELGPSAVSAGTSIIQSHENTTRLIIANVVRICLWNALAASGINAVHNRSVE